MYIQTFTGKKFDIENPRVEDVDIIDIAHGLANQCRFNGQCKRFYSVAEHSLLMSLLIDNEYAQYDIPRYALLHDASEAYTGDMITQLKNSEHMNGFREIEKNLQATIYESFRLSPHQPEIISLLDRALLYKEAEQMMYDVTAWEGWEEQKSRGVDIIFTPYFLAPQDAESSFLRQFNDLFNKKSRIF